MSEETGKAVELYGNMDAMVWAKEFVKRFGGDESLMVAWFAATIMTGYDYGHGPINGDHAQHIIDTERANGNEGMEEARGIVARCWCQPSTSKTVMDPILAEEFAKTLLPFLRKAALCERMADKLALILPMAKGYAFEHPVGSNQKYVELAEEVKAEFDREAKK